MYNKAAGGKGDPNSRRKKPKENNQLLLRTSESEHRVYNAWNPFFTASLTVSRLIRCIFVASVVTCALGGDLQAGQASGQDPTMSPFTKNTLHYRGTDRSKHGRATRRPAKCISEKLHLGKVQCALGMKEMQGKQS